MPALEELLDGAAREERGPDRKRQGFEDTVWFRLNVGRKDNADARWILPLLCRRGHITKNEIGAIKIGQAETMFDIPRAAAARFAEALKRTAQDDPDDGIIIDALPGNPRDAARANKRGDGPNRPVEQRSGSGDRRPHFSEGRDSKPQRSGPDRGSSDRKPTERARFDSGRPEGNWAGKKPGGRPGGGKPFGDRPGGGKPFKGKPRPRP